MRWPVGVIFLLLTVAVALPAWGQRGGDRAREAMRDAAIRNAVASLREQVEQEPVGRNLTVGDLLKRTGGETELTKTLDRAELIGGPRWVDDQTLQVHLEISGTRVLRAIEQIVASRPGKSPVPADVLEVNLRDWTRRSFSATGTSTGPAEAMNLRPSAPVAGWEGVNEEERRKAVAAAQADAAHEVIESIRPIAPPDGKTVGEVMDKNEAVKKAVVDWLASRPVTRMQFQPGQRVDLEISASPAQLFEVFHDAAVGEHAVNTAPDDPAWARVRDDFAAKMAAPVGHGRAAAEGGGNAMAAQDAGPRMPERPPQWADQQIDAEGTARGATLRARRDAEDDAMRKLRSKLDALPMGERRTLGDVAKEDGQVRRALQRSERYARPYKTDFDGATGTVKVRVSLDLRDVWGELQQGKGEP